MCLKMRIKTISCIVRREMKKTIILIAAGIAAASVLVLVYGCASGFGAAKVRTVSA